MKITIEVDLRELSLKLPELDNLASEFYGKVVDMAVAGSQIEDEHIATVEFDDCQFEQTNINLQATAGTKASLSLSGSSATFNKESFLKALNIFKEKKQE